MIIIFSKISRLDKCRNILTKSIILKIPCSRIYSTDENFKKPNVNQERKARDDFLKETTLTHANQKSQIKTTETIRLKIFGETFYNAIKFDEMKRSISLLIPKFKPKIKTSGETLSKFNPFKSKSVRSPSTGKFDLFKSKSMKTPSKFSSLRLFQEKKKPLSSRIKARISRFFFKTVVILGVLYAYSFYRIWGSIDDSVKLYSTIKANMFRYELVIEPLDSEQVTATAQRRYNEFVQLAVCFLIALPDLAFCYIDLGIHYSVEWIKEKYKEYPKQKG